MFIYDVALSFADKDREYVKDIAFLLKERGIKIYYDKFEISSLLGKDLYQTYNDIYKNKAKYFLAFISREYIKDKWAKLQLKSAQARELKSDDEYILPIYLDNIKVPGLNETVGCLHASEYSKEEIVEIIEEKLKKNVNIKQLHTELQDYLLGFVISYIIIGGEKELLFFEDEKTKFKNFLLNNAFELNKEIYLACCAMIEDVENKFSERKERLFDKEVKISSEEYRVSCMLDSILIYRKFLQLKFVIQFYIENNCDNGLDFIDFCEEHGFYNKLNDEIINFLVGEIFSIFEVYADTFME